MKTARMTPFILLAVFLPWYFGVSLYSLSLTGLSVFLLVIQLVGYRHQSMISKVNMSLIWGALTVAIVLFALISMFGFKELSSAAEILSLIVIIVPCLNFFADLAESIAEDFVA